MQKPSGDDNMRQHRHTALRPIRRTLLALALVLSVAAAAYAKADADWRIHIRDAAVVMGERVRLGEIADPSGTIHPGNWQRFADMELWPSPPRPGQPMSISRTRLHEELTKYLGENAQLAVLPPSIAIQKGGSVLRQDELHTLVVSSLTRHTGTMQGEAGIRDIQLPSYIFLRDRLNRLEVEPPTSLSPGQLPIRLREVTQRGEIVRRITGGAVLDQWVTVPCAAIPLNRLDTLTPESVTFARKNLAFVRGDVWDGKGGPWRVLRSVGAGSVIYLTDLEPLPLLQKGSRVELIYQGKSLRLTVPAEAMADGKPGEMIPVRNLQTQKQIYASVRDENTVVISR